MNRFNKIAYVFFGKYVKKNKESYSSLQAAIKQAHFDQPWDVYVSTAYFFAFATGITGLVCGYILMPLWRFLYIKYLEVISKSGISSFEGLSNHGESLFILISALILSLGLGLITYFAIIAYPALEAQTRKSKIDLTLPHTVAYMHALSKGRLNLISIFKSLSEHINIYGEAAEEIKYILIDTEMHGSDMITALKKAAVQTQSEKFRDFLENLVNIIETGGDLESFFSNVMDHYQKSAEADQSMYLETLGMLAETYVTIFVAGPLFVITIMIVMGMTGSGSLVILKLLIYLIIPLCAVFFSVLVSVISLQNGTETIKIYSVSKKINHYEDIRIVPSKDDERKVRKLLRSLRWTSALEIRKNPLKAFFSDPFKAFYFAVPAALIYFILSIYEQKITIDILDDSIIISTFILLVPFLFFYNMQLRRIRTIESSIPGFLRRLAAVNDVGMPLADAIGSISRINIGVLSTEVRLMYKDLVWSNSVHNALSKFERRVRTLSISRIVTLITKASDTTGNIKETLKVAANDAALAEKLRSQKSTVMISYLVVVYISFGVFLLVLYVFATMFLPMIPDSSSANTNMFSMSADKDEYIRLFMHATVIQGFFSGIIVGQMMGDSIYDGLKHSMVMMFVAYVFFVVLV